LPKDREEIWSTLEMSFSIFFKKTWIKKRYRVLLEMVQEASFEVDRSKFSLPRSFLLG
jgi:hypothetical protein